MTIYGQKLFSYTLGFDELPSLRHRSELSYTEAVLHESMRLSSIVPTGIPHMTTCDTSVGQYKQCNKLRCLHRLKTC